MKDYIAPEITITKFDIEPVLASNGSVILNHDETDIIFRIERVFD